MIGVRVRGHDEIELSHTVSPERLNDDVSGFRRAGVNEDGFPVRRPDEETISLTHVQTVDGEPAGRRRRPGKPALLPKVSENDERHADDKCRSPEKLLGSSSDHERVFSKKDRIRSSSRQQAGDSEDEKADRPPRHEEGYLFDFVIPTDGTFSRFIEDRLR